MKTQVDEKIRINKFLANAGVASRRQADILITEGRVKVNRETIFDLGVKIDPQKDKIFVDDKQIVILDEKVYILLNKPKDSIATARDERGRTTVMDYINAKERVFPVGRLDRNTTGVLLFTNDGDFANKLMHPKYEVKKAYKVTIDKPIKLEDVRKLKEGVRLYDGKTKPAEIYIVPREKNKVVGVIIHEGRNRQIHRMFESLGYEVHKLDRIAYGDISYEGLPRGHWRHLTKTEVRKLKNTAGILEG
ncbi:MAG: rRNA pseudouridine synthase [Ignavibacteriales bacterium]|nr:rRNA pseudouridine synthase [Ignavibacteriales bacterium]